MRSDPPVNGPDLRNRLPDPGAGFVWETYEHGSGEYPALHPVTDDAVAAFTTRLGGVSLSPLDELNVSMSPELGDHPARVFCNRDLASRTIGGSWMWATVHQVHGANVAYARRNVRPDADALWTDEPIHTMAVVTADCLPVLLVGERGIAAAHAGWRGLVAGVIEEAISAIDARAVFLGPAIGPCCFRIGDDVAEPFRERFGDAVMVDSRHADLWLAAERAAEAAGVSEIRSSRLCTSCHAELFFSHRRDLGFTGRQALVARLV